MQGKDDIIMVRSERKIKKYEIILCILVLAVIAAGLLLPETGNLVLLDELCNAAVIWIGKLWGRRPLLYVWLPHSGFQKT